LAPWARRRKGLTGVVAHGPPSLAARCVGRCRGPVVPPAGAPVVLCRTLRDHRTNLATALAGGPAVVLASIAGDVDAVTRLTVEDPGCVHATAAVSGWVRARARSRTGVSSMPQPSNCPPAALVLCVPKARCLCARHACAFRPRVFVRARACVPPFLCAPLWLATRRTAATPCTPRARRVTSPWSVSYCPRAPLRAPPCTWCTGTTRRRR
jgi:hypothetical protein